MKARSPQAVYEPLVRAVPAGSMPAFALHPTEVRHFQGPLLTGIFPAKSLWLRVNLWRLRRIERSLERLQAQHSTLPPGSSIESVTSLRHEFNRLAIRRERLRVRIESAR